LQRSVARRFKVVRMDFETFNASAWDEHATGPRAVASRLREQGVTLITSEAQLVQLMNLAHHVHGAHLNEASAGKAVFAELMASAFFSTDGESGDMARRCVASLSLTSQEEFSVADLTISDQIRVQAMAAANLADTDPARGMCLLQAALDQAEHSGLQATDAMNRALAVSGHNLAAALEEKPALSSGEIKLMLMASQASRVYWERAGTWLQVERAEYQLATTFLKAGDLAQAEFHARECGRIVAENDAPALERFFAFEVLARVMRAAQNDAAYRGACEQAKMVFDGLDDGDKVWCAGSLGELLEP
jgi:hypothetical protein